MQLKTSERKQVKLRLGISGASGFGKTKSALLLAYGMTGDWSKIAVIDTENSSASLYADMGSYNVLELQPPHNPEKFIQAIELCEKEGMEVIILDSISHEWNGIGGCLEIHEQLGGRFQDWAKVTPRHQAFVNKILQSTSHIITTTRRKVDYSMDVGSNGRAKVVKHGTKEITREGFEYELTVNFELINENHLCKASKDRTGLFMNKPEFVITPQTGETILKWCNSSNQKEIQDNSGFSEQDVAEKIKTCHSVIELVELYNKYPKFQEKLKPEFQARKLAIKLLSNTQNFLSNGHEN